MPLLRITTSKQVDISIQKNILKMFSSLLANILSKSEDYIQTIFHDNKIMTFAKTSEDTAFIEIKSIGGLTAVHCQDLTSQCCSLLEKELNIQASRIYVEFSDIHATLFGWNNKTFG